MNDVISVQSKYYKVVGISKETLTITNNRIGNNTNVSVNDAKLESRRVLQATIDEMYPIDEFMDFRLLFPLTKVLLHDPTFEPPPPDFSNNNEIVQDMETSQEYGDGE